MTRRVRLVMDAVMLLVFLAALIPATTGVALHEVLGLALFGAVFMHMVVNWDWVLHVAARVFSRIRAASKARLAVDALLFGSAVTVTLSGLLISQTLASAIRVTAAVTPAWSTAHSVSARLALLLLSIHVGMHASWIAGTLRTVRSGTRPLEVRS